MTANSLAGPIVIAHRGASGYLPEHTLEAYTMAYAMGADYVEPDVVKTKDGVFICLHDIHLEATTDVEERYPDRAREDGRYYAADFTLEEVRTLRAEERTAGRFPRAKSAFQVPTFREMIELIQGLNESTGRDVGIYPELKGPSFHEEEGLAMEEDFLALIEAYGYKGRDARIFVQCFEAGPLKKLRQELGCDVPQIFLMGGGGRLDDDALKAIAEYADGIGPSKTMIERDPDVVERAHRHGLQVHPYTLRMDQVPRKYENGEAELRQYFNVYKVDGLFTDFPDAGVRVRDAK